MEYGSAACCLAADSEQEVAETEAEPDVGGSEVKPRRRRLTFRARQGRATAGSARGRFVAAKTIVDRGGSAAVEAEKSSGRRRVRAPRKWSQRRLNMRARGSVRHEGPIHFAKPGAAPPPETQRNPTHSPTSCRTTPPRRLRPLLPRTGTATPCSHAPSAAAPCSHASPPPLLPRAASLSPTAGRVPYPASASSFPHVDDGRLVDANRLLPRRRPPLPLALAASVPPSTMRLLLDPAVERVGRPGHNRASSSPAATPARGFPARRIRWVHAFLAAVSVSTRVVERAAECGFGCRCVQQSNPIAPGRPATCRAMVFCCKSASNISDRTLQPPHGY
ncbi:serine/arginine repetitive matrix protein 1-like [Triticum urartu]|uniref:serine/arginine repetitive matrix protein 1-like n=1 Tax=Triticum urartu TaxID=4572 RepID=UPI0020435893|nr:serine/arginine repetitive matrix protein 1-like [Triticum urartu]